VKDAAGVENVTAASEREPEMVTGAYPLAGDEPTGWGEHAHLAGQPSAPVPWRGKWAAVKGCDGRPRPSGLSRLARCGRKSCERGETYARLPVRSIRSGWLCCGFSAIGPCTSGGA
jgi:hypothetical protein